METQIIIPLKLESKYEKFQFHKWVSTWSYTEYSRSNSLHNIQYSIKENFKKYTYENIQIPENIYYSLSEKKKTEKLISELKLYSGQPFPEKINNEFLKLAESRLKQRTFDQYFIKNIKRVLFLLFNPVSSNGLPIEINNEKVYKNLFDDKKYKIKVFLLEFKNEVLKFVLKFLVNSWKIILILFFLYLILFKKITQNNNSTIFLISCYSFYLIKILFLSIFFLLESRYLATASFY